MESLRRIAEPIILGDHIRDLEKQRRDKDLFRALDINGKMYGRAIEKDGRTYRKYRDQGIPMRRLRNDEKGYGCRSLYRRSLQSLFTPNCHNCQKKFCAYCTFRAAGHVFHGGNDSLLMFASIMTRPLRAWGTFRQENNFARTKIIIKKLQSDSKFMVALTRLLLAHVGVPPENVDDDDEENAYHPPWTHNIIFCLVLVMVVFIFVSSTS